MKRILIVADEPGWIFERHAMEIKRRLTEYHIDIAYHRENIPAISIRYDLIYVMDPMPMIYPDPRQTIMGLRCEFLFREHPQGAKGLYEHGFPGRCASIKDKCKIFHVVNKYQMEVFRDVVTDKPLFLAQHGVDENVFVRSKYPKIPNEKITVSISGRGSNNKGFEMVHEACHLMGFELMPTQYGRRQLTKEQMPGFYNKADVHVCMSQTEGLNNAILEAGAMGVPVISTRSGAAVEIIKDGENGFLIERNTKSLMQALEHIKDDHVRKVMGNRMHMEIITNWTWAVRIEDFRKMFGNFFGESQ